MKRALVIAAFLAGPTTIGVAVFLWADQPYGPVAIAIGAIVAILAVGYIADRTETREIRPLRRSVRRCQ